MSADHRHDQDPREASTDRDRTASPPGAEPDEPAAGYEPMPEVPGGPQVDVPAAQGHPPPEEEQRRR